MRFALVSTCWNEASSFPKWKNDVLDQTRPPDEICIVDAASTDGTVEMLLAWAKEDPRVHIRVESSRPARGRNLAVAMSTCEVIVSTDMGCRLDKNWFAEMCKLFENDSRIEVVAGNYGPDMKTVRTAAAWAAFYLANGYRPVMGQGFLPSNRSVAYTRQAWQQLGGLPEDLSFAADDAVMGLQLNASGLKVAYAEKAMAYWGRYGSVREYWKEQYRYGYGAGEANILARRAIRLMLRGWPKLMIYLSALSRVWHDAPSSIRQAWRGRHYAAVALLFPLIVGNEIAYNRGFLAGYQHGASACLSCRARLGS